MWGSLVVRLFVRPWARRVAGFGRAVLTLTLFILNLRRQGGRAGRFAERLDTLERTDAIQHQMLDAAANRPRCRDDLLDRLRRGSSDRGAGTCPAVVEYSQDKQARVAKELASLPERAVIPEWLADYAVLREQVRACR